MLKFTYYIKSIFVDDNVINKLNQLEKNNKTFDKTYKNYYKKLDNIELNMKNKIEVLENKVYNNEKKFESLSTDILKKNDDIIILKNYMNTNINYNTQIKNFIEKEFKSLLTDISKNTDDIIIIKNNINTNIENNIQIKQRLNVFEKEQKSIEKSIKNMEINNLKLIDKLNKRIETCDNECKLNYQNLYQNLDNMKNVRKMLVMN